MPRARCQFHRPRLFVFLSIAAVCGPCDRRLFNFAGFEFAYFNVGAYD